MKSIIMYDVPRTISQLTPHYILIKEKWIMENNDKYSQTNMILEIWR